MKLRVLIQNRDWRGAKERARSHPNDIVAVDPYGRNGLYYAAAAGEASVRGETNNGTDVDAMTTTKDCPLDVLEVLLREDRRRWQQERTTKIVNDEVVVVSSRKKTQVSSSFLSLTSQSAEMLSSLAACMIIVDDACNALFVTARRFILAVEQGRIRPEHVKEQILPFYQLFIDYAPECLLQRNYLGDTILHYILKLFSHRESAGGALRSRDEEDVVAICSLLAKAEPRLLYSLRDRHSTNPMTIVSSGLRAVGDDSSLMMSKLKRTTPFHQLLLFVPYGQVALFDVLLPPLSPQDRPSATKIMLDSNNDVDDDNERGDDSNMYLLHRLIAFSWTDAKDVKKFLERCYPTTLQQRLVLLEQDPLDGNTPLHIALEMMHKSSNNNHTVDMKEKKMRREIVQRLISFQPQAIRIANHYGVHPLDIAIRGNMTNDLLNSRMIHRILYWYPLALEKHALHEALYPRILYNMKQVNSMFELLRTKPSLLQR